MTTAVAAPSTTSHLIRETESFLLRYVSFPSTDHSFAAALWAVGTYLWPDFDAYPYLVITSDTKRSGKSRFSELLQFLSNNPRGMTGVTVATIFRSIKDQQPTLFIDEAETLASGEANTLRSVLNAGYRRGQMVPRIQDNVVEDFPTYCPKCFVLIGDVYDTLRDRSIVVRMKRSAAPSRFVYTIAKSDGNGIADQLKSTAAAHKEEILTAYTNHEGLPYLQDRDEEIWTPLFAICSVLAPERIEELQRVAVDMSTEKTADARRHADLTKTAEVDAESDEYALRLLRDLYTVMGTHKTIFTTDALAALRALSTGPWRKFRGEGLTAMEMGSLLGQFKGVRPKLIRVGGKGKNAKVARGYTRAMVETALRDL